MESNGLAGAVCISEQTYKLIQRDNVYSETFEFKEHRDCEIGVIGKTIKSYIVEQIYNAQGESSEEFSEDGEQEEGPDGSHSQSDYD